MHLVACKKCRRQYDVTNEAEGDGVRCECGEMVIVVHHAPHDPRPVRCSSCGGALAEGALSCGYCQSSVTLEERLLSSICPECFARLTKDAGFCMECGVKIAPQNLVAVPPDSSCPRCQGELRSRALEGTSLIECSACAGIWLPPETFSAVCRDAERRARLDEGLFGGEAMPKQPPRHEFRYLKCITCKDFMIPRNFGGNSGVMIDVCKRHGVWLDHAELERIVDYVRRRGNAPPEAHGEPRPMERTPLPPRETPVRSHGYPMSTGADILIDVIANLFNL